MDGFELVGQLGMDLDQPRSVAIDPGVSLNAGALQAGLGDLLGLSEQVATEDDRRVAGHVHRERVRADDLAVPAGDVDRAAIEVADAVALPATAAIIVG